MQKFKETGDSWYIYQNEIDKSRFQHDMGYGNFINLTSRTASDKILRDKAFNIVKNLKYSGYQRPSVVYNFFFFLDKKIAGGAIKNEIMSNKELAEELHKKIIKKIIKRKVHSHFIDDIWGADLVDMQLVCKFKKGIHFLLCAIDIFSK